MRDWDCCGAEQEACRDVSGEYKAPSITMGELSAFHKFSDRSGSEANGGTINKYAGGSKQDTPEPHRMQRRDYNGPVSGVEERREEETAGVHQADAAENPQEIVSSSKASAQTKNKSGNPARGEIGEGSADAGETVRRVGLSEGSGPICTSELRSDSMADRFTGDAGEG